MPIWRSDDTSGLVAVKKGRRTRFPVLNDVTILGVAAILLFVGWTLAACFYYRWKTQEFVVEELAKLRVTIEALPEASCPDCAQLRNVLAETLHRMPSTAVRPALDEDDG